MNSFSFVSHIFKFLEGDEVPIVVRHEQKKIREPKNRIRPGSTIDVWPVYFPTQAILRQPGAWYFSVAAHRIEGKLRRSKHLFSSAHCIVLDDVGTKVARSAIPEGCRPSWILETSKGNFQYGYLIHRYPDQTNYEAVMRALAAAKLTDAGAIDSVRLFRLPGSLHKTGFEAVLHEFSPKRRYLLKNLVKNFGLPDLAFLPKQRRYQAPQVPDDAAVQADWLYHWLTEHQLSDGAVNASGWVDTRCPWAEFHSDPMLTQARYMPGEMAFHCFHEACSSRSSMDFIEWATHQERLICLERAVQAQGEEVLLTEAKAKRNAKALAKRSRSSSLTKTS